MKEIKLSREEFETFVNQRLDMCVRTLLWKAREYADDEDRAKNFNVAGRMLGLKPYQVAFLYMMKHFESVYEIVMEGKEVPPHVWDEKITDLINYLLLIDAMKRKEYKEKPFVEPPEPESNARRLSREGN